MNGCDYDTFVKIYESVDYGKGQYVCGNAYTAIEGFWSGFKRSIQRYCH